MAGGLTMALTPTIEVLMVGRVIAGIGAGSSNVAVPLYLSEMAPVKVRGIVISSYVTLNYIGTIGSLIIALLCDRNWRLMIGLDVALALIYGILTFYLPESPRWLAKHGRYSEANEVIRLIYDDE